MKKLHFVEVLQCLAADPYPGFKVWGRQSTFLGVQYFVLLYV